MCIYILNDIRLSKKKSSFYILFYIIILYIYNYIVIFKYKSKLILK